MVRRCLEPTTDGVPVVSIVIPVYNDSNGIRITLDSLLSQSYPVENREIIVVDNGSTDETRDMIYQFVEAYDRIHLLVENAVQGSYAARNKGIRNANEEIIAFLDADVPVDHNWLERGVEYVSGGVDYWPVMLNSTR